MCHYVVPAWAIVLAIVLNGVEGRAAPNLLFVLADDFGYYDVQWKNAAARTPVLNELHKTGLDLTRFYTYQYCSPTRCSLLSGRLPIHVNTDNNPASKFGGVDLRMTLVSEKLKARGYFTACAGKWHAGGHLEGQLPINRGFDRSRVFLNGNEDHYSHYFGIDKGFDLWQDQANLYDNVTYGGYLYTNYAVQTIMDFNPAAHTGLFLYLPFQNTHTPFQVPDSFRDPKIATTKNKQTYYGMATFMDEAIGNVTQALKKKGLWNNTLILFSADNGGDVAGAGNNYGLRGGKYTDFEGGTRNVAFASGGWLADELRGTSTTELLHVADIWATFASLAGDSAPTVDAATVAWNAANPQDRVPLPDSFDASAVLTTLGAKSGRREVPLSKTALIVVGNNSSPSPSPSPAGMHSQNDSLSTPLYKILTEPTSKHNIFTSPEWPAFDENNSACVPEKGKACEPFCLFDVAADPSERNDISGTLVGKQVAAKLQARLAELAATVWSTHDEAYRGNYTNCTSLSQYKADHQGYLGPLCSQAHVTAANNDESYSYSVEN